MPARDDHPGPLRTALVTLAVCVVASALVSTTAVLLRPIQAANREAERRERILAIVGRQPELQEMFARLGDASVEARVVELATGAFADWIDPGDFDARGAETDPLESVEIPPGRDLAGIGRRARYATVYVVEREGELALVVLPVHGSGYASTLYGYLALSPDGATVRGLSFYEHGETPGLGAEIEDPEWLAQWVGRRVRDEEGRLRLGIAPDVVEPDSEEAPYLVDGLTGATRTCDGITNLLRFWLGEDGFAPFLERIRS